MLMALSLPGLLGVVGERPLAPILHLLSPLCPLGPKDAPVSQLSTTP